MRENPLCSGTRTDDPTCPARTLLQRQMGLRQSLTHKAEPTKYLAGVPIYNYGYVLSLEAGIVLAESRNEEAVPEVLSEVRRPGKVVHDWIVKLHKNASNADVHEFCGSLPGSARCLAEGHPSQKGVPMVEIRATEAELEEQLRTHQAVSEFVEPDVPMDGGPLDRDNETDGKKETAIMSDFTKPPEPESWGLDRIDSRKGVDNVFDVALSGGRGVHVYVADTGIRCTHEDFEGRAIPCIEALGNGVQECWENDMKCATDKNGHGTHAAGTVGGKSYGVAKGATLYAVKVLSDDGKGRMSNLIFALDWVTANGKRPAVFSASLGSPGQPPAVTAAVEAAVAAGITVVVAAGNFNKDACEYAPANIASAITVGATANSRDKMAGYSNHGKCIDIIAPGSKIFSAGIESDSAKAKMSGTSMACPHVAGAAALLIGEDQRRKPADVKRMLLESATKDSVRKLPSDTPNLLLYTPPLNADPVMAAASAATKWSSMWMYPLMFLAGISTCCITCLMFLLGIGALLAKLLRRAASTIDQVASTLEQSPLSAKPASDSPGDPSPQPAS